MVVGVDALYFGHDLFAFLRVGLEVKHHAVVVCAHRSVDGSPIGQLTALLHLADGRAFVNRRQPVGDALLLENSL
ncbi:hypothetical protein [Paenibacillus sp. N3.4]|uniref:hypothetical protein n=1 Tax=Paenibacillus sp. N3.4 TaxID=2603222 RepID=UPI0011C9DD93|nr:hypothetical protein [Paenibacillus sp. N3.4]TXK75882.1 hypothetical protein FU659_26885 [Paenibacillus sp. N3.4]